ncbi:MAG: bifunctional UDP-N-acetylglucosamine diphosphorylase/glucosamine-1-phosphate N-acetyltransferase GlmU [Pyrinomonadaceae bacterium]|nr:bifunctional UDP-N-acetylglucosamine diphosphorylase/glucosamine-1-phosphate N-acetyltransferase GlmU [Pyrinomonadaceae bacterium]
MKSQKAKVLHELGGHPLIAHVTRKAHALDHEKIYVVVGHQAADVEAAVRRELASDTDAAAFVTQKQQRGTGDAVMSAAEALKDANSNLLVLSGDVPLVRVETLQKFVDYHRANGAACSILSVTRENPTGYGRMVRDASEGFAQIVEQKDATSEEKLIHEINSGIYCFETTKLFSALNDVKPANQQGEYYLTDVPAILAAGGEKITIYLHQDAREVSGINTRADLAEFENLLRRGTIRGLMTEGVTFIDPSHAYVSVEAQIGHDCVIYPGVLIEGDTVIGEESVIRSGCRITNSKIGTHVTIKDYCVIVDSEIASNCTVGPFAHLRMNTRLEEGSVIGNFVEVKKSRMGRGSKSMHLTYLGDATIGEQTNIGAGTITCNYDGKKKHETIIEDNVKIGSDTLLVAPVTVGSGSITAAGSVVTKDVPPNSLVAGVPAVVKKKLKNRDE